MDGIADSYISHYMGTRLEADQKHTRGIVNCSR